MCPLWSCSQPASYWQQCCSQYVVTLFMDLHRPLVKCNRVQSYLPPRGVSHLLLPLCPFQEHLLTQSHQGSRAPGVGVIGNASLGEATKHTAGPPLEPAHQGTQDQWTPSTPTLCRVNSRYTRHMESRSVGRTHYLSRLSKKTIQIFALVSPTPPAIKPFPP